MSDPKKPGAADLDQLRARLGLNQGGGLGGAQPGGSPAPGGLGGAVPPPAFGPDAAPPPVAPGSAEPPPPEAATSEEPPEDAEDPTEEIDVPPGPEGSGAPAPAAVSDVPPPAAPASAPPVAAVTPPSFAPQAAPAPAPAVSPPAGSPAVAPPSFAPAQPNVSPPPFGAQPEEEGEEEVVREVVRRKLIDDGVPVEDKEVGRVQLGPYVAVVVTIALAAIFGVLCGGQIDRAVRRNRAIESADAIHAAVVADQTALKNLKSRISGAARKALHKTSPGPDFELLDHLSTIKGQRPFGAKVWSGEFYQAFKCAPLLFEYYNKVNSLWDTVGEVADRQGDPSVRAALKSWPEERVRVTKLNATDGSTGWGVAFRRSEGKILAVLGVFRNSRRERVGRDERWRSDFTPFGASSAKTLNEYQPGFDPLNEEPDEWFVRVNPDLVLGPKRQVINYGGPLVGEAQDPYLRYLMDVNSLSKALAGVQASQDNLLQGLAEIKQDRRVFTFGF